MLAKHLTGKPLAAALRSRANLSVLSAAEEFPHKEVAGKKQTVAAVHKQATLDNGVRVVTRERDASVVNLQFAVLGGSSTETAAQKGAAHLLAAAAFAGNKSQSGLKIVRALESHGVKFSSFADREKVVYDVTLLADKVEPVFATVAGAIATGPHANFVLDEVREQAQLAYDEFAASPEQQLRELIHETAFGEVSPLGAPFFASSLDKLSAESVLEYRAAHFLCNNLVIAANGVSVDTLKTLTDKYAKEIPAGAQAKALPASPYVGGDNKVRVDLDGKTNLAVAFPVPSGAAGKAYEVLNQVLSVSLAAKGVCANTFLWTHSAQGLFGLRTAGSAEQATQHLHTAVQELKAIAAGNVDVTAAKNKVSVARYLALESANASPLLEAYLVGEDASKLADNRAVTNQSVAEAAAKVLKAVPTYAVLGATAGTPTYSAIQKLLA